MSCTWDNLKWIHRPISQFGLKPQNPLVRNHNRVFSDAGNEDVKNSHALDLYGVWQEKQLSIATKATMKAINLELIFGFKTQNML